MKRIFCLAALAAVALASCKDNFKKTTNGMEYKIVPSGSGAKLADGNFIELALRIEYKDASIDTVLMNSKEMGNQIFPFSNQIPAPYYNIFAGLRSGDSVVIKQLTDSVMKGGQALPFMKKGQYLITSFKLVNIFTTKEQADSAMQINSKIANAKRYDQTIAQLKSTLASTDAAQVKTDDAILNAYMTKNNLKGVKSELGCYVVLTEPGTGENLDRNSIAVVKYTGKTLQDTVFDSNVDPSFNHPQPLDVNLGEFRMIPGWIDGLKLMKKGSKGLLLVPSSLGYGKTGAGAKIKPNENLVFNIEIIDVKTAEQELAERKAKQAEMAAQRQRYADSVQKANGGAGAQEVAPPTR